MSLAAFAEITTATITTVLFNKGLRNVWMRGPKPLANATGRRIAGRAFTLRFVPAREDLATPASWASPKSTRAAIEAMPEGAIVVADAMGVTDAGIFGDILCARMQKRRLAALVTDGVLRDVAGVAKTGLPVWSAGAAAPASVAGLTFVNWQEPIGCGGVAVFPDDVIVADDDGAVVIPAALVDHVIVAGPAAGTVGSLDHGRGREGRAPAGALSAQRRDLGALRGRKKIALMNTTRSSYDRLAAEYTRLLYNELDHKPLDRELLDRFARLVKGKGRACDMGCGPGQVAAYLRARGLDMLGIDLSPGMIAQARKANPGIEFREADMRALPLPDGSLAGIAAFYSILHFPRNEVTGALKEFARVLRPAGVALVAFHIGDEVLHRDELFGEAVTLDFTLFQPLEVEGYLRDAGFTVDETIVRPPYPDAEYPSHRAYIFASKNEAD